MRIAFLGTPDFAVESLKILVENGKNIVAVVTAPDKPSGRGLKLSQSEVKKYAHAQNLHILQPEKLRAEDFLAEWKRLDIDVAVVVAFRMLPEVVWAMPKMGTFNLHGSLLPQYRGAAPINWAIMNGEKTTGVTTFLLNAEIDKGNIIAQKEIEIGEADDFGTMYQKMKIIGAELVLKTIEAMEKGEVQTFPQPFSPTDKPAPKITKEVLEITNFEDCTAIHNKIRGLIPAYKPFVRIENKPYIIKKGNPILGSTHQNSEKNYATDGKTYLHLCCQNGVYNVLEIQAEGKKPMDIVHFLNGNRI